MTLFSTQILGTGKYHPEKILTNEEISKRVDTSDEWIVQRTGIKQRRIGDLSKDECPSGMAVTATKEAVKNAGLKLEDIDLILFSVTLPDMFFPNSASQLQGKLGLSGKCGCLDINAACTGWLYGLQMADALIKAGVHKTILLVGSEMPSGFNNWDDRSTCVLFGDGCGVTLLGRTTDKSSSRVIDSIVNCEGDKGDALIMKNGAALGRITHEILDKNEQWMTMDGQVVFKTAVKTMSTQSAQLLERNNLTIDDIDWFIPHQANLRIIELTAKLLNYPMEKVIVNVQKYANTSSASIPVAIHEALMDGRLKRGQKILMSAFGSGLTSGAALIEL